MAMTKLQWRPEARVEPVDDGLVLYTHRGSTVLEGKGLAPWVEAVRPMLDGTSDRSEILSGIDDARSAAVATLLDRLVQVGAVREVDPDEPPLRTDRDEERFVGYFRTGAAAAYARFRTMAAVVVGTGEPARVLLDGCRDAGMVTVERREPDDLVGAEVVLHVLDSREDPSARPVSQWCRQHRTPLLQVLHHGGRTWVALPRTPDGSAPGLFPALRRLAADGAPDDVSVADGLASTAPGPRVACLRAVHELMRWACGIADTGRPGFRILALDDVTLATSEHPVVPHPLDGPPAPGPAPDVTGWPRLEPVPAEQFSVAAAALMDSRTGVFGTITEGALSQLPLNRSRTEVRTTEDGGVRHLEVRGAGAGFEEARQEVAFTALTRYALATVDPRRLHDDLVSGVDLVTGARVDVPAARVFEPASGSASPLGAAAGLSWEAAVESALAGHVRAALLAEVDAGAAPASELELDPARDTRLPYLVSMLHALGEPPRPVLVRGASGITGVGLLRDDALLALAWRTDVGEALVDVLTARLLAFQERLDDGPDGGAPPPVSPGPVGVGPDPAQDPAAVPATGPAETVARLGGRWVAVPLDHDPAVTAATPFVLRVLEVDDAGRA